MIDALRQSLGDAVTLREIPLARVDASHTPPGYTLVDDALRGLSLRDCGLAELPAALFRCTTLHKLALGRNRLREIPQAMSALHNLTHLYLDGNRLHMLPDAICELEALQVFDLVLSHSGYEG